MESDKFTTIDKLKKLTVSQKRRNSSIIVSESILGDYVAQGSPFSAAYLSYLETLLFKFYYSKFKFLKRWRLKKIINFYKEKYNFCPLTEESFIFLAKLLSNAVASLDVFLHESASCEKRIYRKTHCRGILAPLEAIDLSKDLWEELLKHKKILLITKNLFMYHSYLELYPHLTFQVLTIDEEDETSNWFENLDRLKMKILQREFDLVFVDADLFSLPIIQFISQLNKQVIRF